MSGMPLKTAISDVYPLPSNATANAGFGALWTVLNEMIEKPELDLASAGTIDLGGQLSTKLRITGTTGPITSFGTTYRGPIFGRFAGILTLTHNATTLILPGGANITTSAGGTFIAVPKATTSGTHDGWMVVYSSDYIAAQNATKADLAGLGTQQFSVAAATTARHAAAFDQVIGLGQTWQNVVASRAVGTIYTNSTTKPIMVCVSIATVSTTSTVVKVDGLIILRAIDPTSNTTTPMTFVVPSGSTYQVLSGTAIEWTELR